MTQPTFPSWFSNYIPAIKGNEEVTFKTYKQRLSIVENKLGHKIGGLHKIKFRLISR